MRCNRHGRVFAQVTTHMIRTKIVATLGPASEEPEQLDALFEAGVDVCRINFSHGNFDGALSALVNVHQAAMRWSEPIAVLGDLPGPKIRLGEVTPVNGTPGMPIAVGETLIIQRAPVIGANARVSSGYERLVDDVQVGHRVLVEDGMLRFICIEKDQEHLACRCTAGGILQRKKGINLPDTAVTIPSITENDWKWVDWAIENDLDYLALSFVRRPDELLQLREYLRGRGSDIHIIAKIEKPEALQRIEAIIDACDGLMVARGDLGVEMDIARVPIIQKDLIRRCRRAGKPVIVATQMLQSMIVESSPTRAEVSDIANAIFDGADAVMLSGETSVGKYPALAVETMNHIAAVTEEYIDSAGTASEPVMQLKSLHLSAALAKGVWQIVHELKLKLVVVWSQTGATARIFSTSHFPVPIVALSSNHKTLRRMALQYGVLTRQMEQPQNAAALVQQTDQVMREQKYAADGDRIVIVSGRSMGTAGAMDSIIIHTVGDPFVEPADNDYTKVMTETERQ